MKKESQNKSLIYVLVGIAIIVVLAIGAIFLISAKSNEPEEESWTTEDLIHQSQSNRQESAAKQLYLKAELEYINTGSFPKELEDFVDDIESAKETLPNLQYTRYGSRGFVITYTNIDGKEEKLTYTAE